MAGVYNKVSEKIDAASDYNALIDLTIKNALKKDDHASFTPPSDAFKNSNDDQYQIQLLPLNSEGQSSLELTIASLYERGQTEADYVERVFSKLTSISDDQELQDFVEGLGAELGEAD